VSGSDRRPRSRRAEFPTFLASTGRSLGAPGHERTFVPLSQFHFADWSHDADGVLDPRRITDVSIGWGG